MTVVLVLAVLSAVLLASVAVTRSRSRRGTGSSAAPRTGHAAAGWMAGGAAGGWGGYGDGGGGGGDGGGGGGGGC